ncbi:methionine adenosyltransferase [Candidatus Roizmanbacteria bacterium CG_4_10_14_0_2_um_filter_36_35]|uniref:Methionine adenosyltransferase n=4 Tax=Candidatus Roizmaniibacteriota TaxID=1752723 RepID=A0A2M7BW00_9BACT|nr:MAG: methionine adenosyltransferase [Candidatus Roizmanbacteria bacterium CG11_big_fil_rev_8_21_14_0_20_35_14]PIV10763.1 MAG: methionine adenosyltransferase [Candidatus Roizmanbacteria bacterium CG03_land_8_20_14_0_80_35_26]PIZ68913.1 MAG: methionine adenosyltransferase [Candidatus Roizmanbacteria bacterium CG_4_10_14_0_2_um_filter_36_35]PJC33467.1 MAG: methionine adenosyltransferase [Candidatus Roizmanbacteria bacterium CG_4_9_14_0_2_um_filter_36_12]PJC79832.1 MAG: methionine adenosyltransf
MRKTFTSESVCAGHPDKICDQISDAILDEALKQDKYSRVAVETMVTKNFVALAGEVTTKAKLNYKSIARKVIKKLGYTNPKLGFTYKSPIIVKIHTQSPEIAVGIDKLGAGDQGMMYGYATNETKEYMPLPIIISHKLAMKIDSLRESKILSYLRPDGKTQITAAYEDGRSKNIETVVLAVPHDEKVSLSQVKRDLFKLCVLPVLQEYGFSIKINQLIVNGTGIWHIGGPASDTGVTGRKIIVDSYGSFAHVGGGCFSGKDPTKVDRSGAYAARFLAKNIVVHSLAKKCEVRLAYFIGAQKPIMQEVETFGTAKKSEKIIKSFMDKLLDTSLQGILDGLNLRRPIYFKTASYGHFGREIFPWEKIVK